MKKGAKKIKIAIVLDEMSIGGIPKACIPFINELLKECDVTMIMRSDKGELHGMLPEGVNVVLAPLGGIRMALSTQIGKGNFVSCLILLLKYLVYAYVQKRWGATSMLLAKHEGMITEEDFDCVIGFHGMSISQLTRTLYQVKAKKKVAWIHGDHPFEGKHMADAKKSYELFDRIYCDSEICKSNFLRDFPEVADKTFVGHPLIDPMEIRGKSMESAEVLFDKNTINLLTVGRISPEKGQDLIPDIILKLRSSGKKIAWYLVGDGEDRERIEKMAINKGCSELHFLGSKVNPYPYMKQCNIYVQPSYSEAYSITAFEAATLGKVSVLTDVAGATEILKDGETTIVVQPETNSIAEGILKLIAEPTLLDQMSLKLMQQDFSNSDEVRQIIEWIRK